MKKRIAQITTALLLIGFISSCAGSKQTSSAHKSTKNCDAYK